LGFDKCDTDSLLSELHTAGAIVRYRHDGGGYIQVRHFLRDQQPHHREAESVIPAYIDEAGAFPGKPGQAPESPDKARPSPVDQDQDQDQDHRSGSRPSDDDRGFDAFWDAYPKKQAKKDTRMAWTKLAPSADLQQTILEAIATHKTGRKWKEGFAPMPATFLRGERWADVLETPALPIGAQPAGADNPCGFGCPHDPSCRSPWDCLALRRAAGETL
jgi:hypothetical protein